MAVEAVVAGLSSHFLANLSPSSPDQVHVGFSISFYDLGL